ncbi:MAG: type IV secretion system protein VirB10 [Campylobacter sp.]|nr:type IV secretion system protein VirB10 [Campylobacter sp.]
MNEQRNQLAGEQTENLKNPFWAYALIGFSVVVIIIILGGIFILKNFSTDEAKEKNKTSYENKEKRNFVSAIIEDKKFEQNTTAEPPKPMIVEANKTTEKKVIPPIITKTGLVVGDAANTGVGVDDSENSRKFRRSQILFNFGQAEDDSGSVTPKMSGEGNGNGEIYSPTAAYFSNFDQNLLLSKGTYIGCSLKTKLVSDIKGGIACVVSNDVYSNNGRTLLIEKGSLITGTYSGASIEEGMERIYVIWQEIRTPNNIIIPVFSGASDELGGAGIAGWVDNHYFKRFGSAILVSVIDDFMSAAATRLSERKNNGNGTNTTNYFNPQATQQQVNDLASKTLDKMINIKPTLYKNHGDIVGVYVNRDIDFRNVYELKRKK